MRRLEDHKMLAGHLGVYCKTGRTAKAWTEAMFENAEPSEALANAAGIFGKNSS